MFVVELEFVMILVKGIELESKYFVKLIIIDGVWGIVEYVFIDF